jgi:hypothetical protein
MQQSGQGVEKPIMTLFMHRGSKVLIEGCALQIAGLAALARVAVPIETPPPLWPAATTITFGYGQGLVMAPALERDALDRRAGHRVRHARPRYRSEMQPVSPPSVRSTLQARDCTHRVQDF